MSEEGFVPGAVAWFDLTVDDATSLKEFYEAVVGWVGSAHPMGEYDDYIMQRPGSDQTVTGICHARSTNADLPPQWLIYINVEDVDVAAERCTSKGGTIVDGPRDMGNRRFAAIRDPAGAVAALIGPAAPGPG